MIPLGRIPWWPWLNVPGLAVSSVGCVPGVSACRGQLGENRGTGEAPEEGWTDPPLCPVPPSHPVLTVSAGDPWLLPLAAGLAPDGGHMTLYKAWGTLVPLHCVDFVACFGASQGPGVLHRRGLSAGHCGEEPSAGAPRWPGWAQGPNTQGEAQVNKVGGSWLGLG